jgi:hypothetical protein
MKCKSIFTSVILASVSVLMLLVGCNQVDQQEALKQRAIKWNAVLETLKSNPDSVTNQQIESFLEPSAVRSQAAQEFRESRATDVSKQVITISSVDDVIISEDGKHGSVRYSVVEEWTGEDTYGVSKGDKRTSTQITQWILIDGTWYRTSQPAVIK